jgi:hypothetical protein
VDLRNLNPRTALTRAVFGDEDDLESLRKLDPRRWDARSAARDFMAPDTETDADEAADSARIDMHKPASTNGTSANGKADRPRPRPRPAAPATPYDDDAT